MAGAIQDAVFRALTIAAIVLGLDILVSHLPIHRELADAGSWLATTIRNADPGGTWPLLNQVAARHGPLDSLGQVKELSPSSRGDLLSTALSLFGVGAPLIITLTSFAVSGLAPYGNPSFLLLYRWRERGWQERILGVISGPTNPFHRSLVLSLGLVGSLIALKVSYVGGLSGNHIAAIGAVGLLAGLLTISFLWFLLWILALRRPSDATATMLSMGYDVLNFVAKVQARRRWQFWRRLRPRDVPCISKDFCTRFEEQEEIRRCIQGLTEAVLRALDQRQRLSALEAVEVLGRLDELASEKKVPANWEQLRGDPVEVPDWLQELFVDSLRSIVVAAAELHYWSVGMPGIGRLEQIGCRLAENKDGVWLGRARVLLKTVEALQFCCDDCIVAKEYELRDETLKAVSAIFDKLPADDGIIAAGELQKQVVGMALRAVELDDIAALRAVLHRVVDTSAKSNAAVDMMGAVLVLGATSFAGRRYSCASALVDYVAHDVTRGKALIRAGERVRTALVGKKLSETALPGAPLNVSADYAMLFAGIVAARAKSQDVYWQGSELPEVKALLNGVSKPNRWAKFTITRMTQAASYPDSQAWIDAVDKVM